MMDTLSSSVPTIKVPAFRSPPREHPHLKLPSHLPSKPNNSSSFISNKALSYVNFPLKLLNPTTPSTSHTSLPPKYSSPNAHQNPATGYAAALLDVARCKGALDVVINDVQRLKQLLQHEQVVTVSGDHLVGVRAKGQVAKGRKFDGLLMGLVKMLAKRNKVGMIREVLMEFERIYDELSGTKVVLVSSKKKIGVDGLLGIATRVSELSGALKVKVRNLVGERSSSFAAV